jgi:hypothetical protein
LRVLALVLLSAAFAQSPAPATEAAPTATDAGRALDLPLRARDLRQQGVPEADVKVVLTTARDKNVPAGEAAEVLDETAKVVREHGPVDNFGAFVQAQLDAGLRGKALADAIKAEHAARGKGHGAEAGADKEHGGGPPDAAGGRGKPDDAGKSGDHGKPDDAGKSGDHGKPDDAGKPGGRTAPGESRGGKK